jgi:hypothetical protein
MPEPCHFIGEVKLGAAPLRVSRVRVFCSEQGVDERAIRASLQKVKTRTLEHRKGAAPNFTKLSVPNGRLE